MCAGGGSEVIGCSQGWHCSPFCCSLHVADWFNFCLCVLVLLLLACCCGVLADYTCWPCYVDALTGPPFTYDEARGIVLDR